MKDSIAPSFTASSLNIPINSILTFQKREKDLVRNIHIDLNACENPLTSTLLYVFFPDHRGKEEQTELYIRPTQCCSIKFRNRDCGEGG